MRVVAINWLELELAFERNIPDSEAFLDLGSGAVVTVAVGALDYDEQRQKVLSHPGQFLRIDPVPSREQYRWMERFLSLVTDEPLRERLMMAIDGKGAFRRFKDVLLGYPTERERWFSYRENLLRWHLLKWVEREGVTSTTPPPWQSPSEPEADPPPVERTGAPAAESPGEGLRRQARELLEQIPAVELPAALAFLEYLRDRGVSELVRPRPVKRTAA